MGEKEDDTVRCTVVFGRCRTVFTGAPIPCQLALVDVKLSPATLNKCFYIQARAYYYGPRRDMFTICVGVNKRYTLYFFFCKVNMFSLYDWIL